MPSADDGAMLRVIAADLREDFPGPSFEPHLTLVEEVERGLGDLTKHCRRIAEGLDRFTVSVEGVETSALYFRSFYVRFSADEPLVRLRERAVAAIAPEHGSPFMPHVSLLYGVADTVEKERARRTIESHVVGRPICFDRICVVASAKTIPIDRWAIASTVGLGAAIDIEPADQADRSHAR